MPEPVSQSSVCESATAQPLYVYCDDVFDTEQRTAVREAFRLAGYDGNLRTLPLDSGDEIGFVLDQADLLAFGDMRGLERVLEQILGRKVWLLASINDNTVPFK